MSAAIRTGSAPWLSIRNSQCPCADGAITFMDTGGGGSFSSPLSWAQAEVDTSRPANSMQRTPL